MFRKLALAGVITAAALTGCATYDQYGYRGQGQGDYYYGRPQVSSSVGVSIGTGYGGYGGYGYGYPSYYGGGYGYGYGYPSYGYGYPYGTYRPYPNRPRPRPDNNHSDRGNQQRPGWRDIEGIKDRNEPRPSGRYIQQAQRDIPQVRESSRGSSNRGSFSGAVDRARRASSERTQAIEP